MNHNDVPVRALRQKLTESQEDGRTVLSKRGFITDSPLVYHINHFIYKNKK